MSDNAKEKLLRWGYELSCYMHNELFAPQKIESVAENTTQKGANPYSLNYNIQKRELFKHLKF